MVLSQHQQLAPQNKTTAPLEEVCIILLNRAFKTFIFFIKAESHFCTSTLELLFVASKRNGGNYLSCTDKTTGLFFSIGPETHHLNHNHQESSNSVCF